MDLPSISQKHTRRSSDIPYYDHSAAQRPLRVNDRDPSLPLPQPEQAYSPGTLSPQVGSLGSLSSSNPLNFRNNYPSLKRNYQDIDTPQSREAVLDYSGEQLPETPQPAINQDHRLLSFSRLPGNFTLSDKDGRVQQIELSAQLQGMFFLSEMATPSGDGLLVQPELTCYRRNLFQISGTVTFPTAWQCLFTEKGKQIPIISLDVTLSASESVEGHPVKLIAVPWKTLPLNSNDSPGQEGEPAGIPLFPMNIGKVSTRTQSNSSPIAAASSDFSVYPITYRRLQFRIATANNGRRRELQQHFTLHLNVVATMANGTECNVCETSSAPIVVRGRSPRNFQARKEIPLVGSSSGPGEDPTPSGTQGSQLEQPKSIAQEHAKQTAPDPEHKAKKPNKRALKAKMEMIHTEAKPGDYFYVKLKGYPLWPAIICDESMLPIPMLKSRPRTAARQDGTYCDEYEDGGSKVKDRTFPVMYLHINEFGWIPNYDLVDLDFEEVKNVPANIAKDLYAAHQLAAEQHDLDYFKDILKSFMVIKEADRAKKEADKAVMIAKKVASGTSIPDPAVHTIDPVLFEPGRSYSKPTGSGVGEISIDLPFQSQASKDTDTKHLLSPIGSPEASIKQHSLFQSRPGSPAKMASMDDSRSLTIPSALSHLYRRLEIQRNDSLGPGSDFATGYSLGLIGGVRSWMTRSRQTNRDSHHGSDSSEDSGDDRSPPRGRDGQTQEDYPSPEPTHLFSHNDRLKQLNVWSTKKMVWVDVEASFVADLSENWIAISLVENLGLKHIYDSECKPQYGHLGGRTIRFKGTTELQWSEKVSLGSNFTLCRVVDDRTTNFLFLQSNSTPPKTLTGQSGPTRDNLTAMSRDSGYARCNGCQGLGHVQADCPNLDLGGAGTTTDRDDLIRDNITTMSRDSGYASGVSHKVVDHDYHNLKFPSDLQLAMPAPLIGNSDLDMVKLASSISCQFCGKTGPLNDGAPLDQWHPGPGENESVPIWAFNISSCGGCLQRRCIKEIDIMLSGFPSPLLAALPYVFFTNELHVIPNVTFTMEYPVGTQIAKCFLMQHVEEIKWEFVEMKRIGSAAVEEWLKGLDERGKARRKDTERWERWQASGGLSRLRSIQNFGTQPVQKGSSISECDFQSVASVQTRITDLTMSSMNPAGLGGAAEEVADLLAESTDVRELISKGFKIMEADRFERNFMRLLKDFAINLRKEATNEVQKGATKLVHSYRAYVTRLIRQKFAGQKDEWQAEALHDIQKQKASKLMLERLILDVVGPSVGETLDQDQESNYGSGFSDDEQALPNLKKVKDFMVSSTAFEGFRRSLHDFINPVSTLKQDGNQMIESVPVLAASENSDDAALVDSQMTDLTIIISRDEDHPMLEVLPESSAIGDGSNDPMDICDNEQSASDVGFIIQPNIPMKRKGDELIDVPPKKQKCDDLEISTKSSPMNIPSYIATHATSAKFAHPSADNLSQRILNDSVVFEVASFDHSPQPTCRYERLEQTDGVDEPSILSTKEAQDSTRNDDPEYEILAASTEPHQPSNSSLGGRLGLLKISRGIGNRFRRFWRPKPGSDSQRVEWTCECGHELYADFKVFNEAVSELAAILQLPISSSSCINGSFNMNDLHGVQAPVSAIVSSRTLSSSTDSSSGSSLSTLLGSTSSMTSNLSSTFSRQAYLELCINTGEYTKTLREINLRNVGCDGELFKEIRNEYYRARNFKSGFWLLKPSGVHFVRFAVEDPLRVGILQKPLSIPPQCEVDSKHYSYSPCPLQDDPPIPQDTFLHYLSCTASNPKSAWMPRLPKKLDPSIMRFTGAVNYGWGIHITEGPNYIAIGVINFLMMVVSGLVAFLWKYFMHDFQGAFGFAGWIVAVVNGILVLYIAKWRFE